MEQTRFRFLTVWIALCLAAAGGARAQATAYKASALGRYTDVDAFMRCAAPLPCRNYQADMAPSGLFTTVAPLAPGLREADVEADLVAFRFSDGLEVYSHTDPAVRVHRFRVSTNAQGQIISPVQIELDRWLTGSSPHAAGDRVASFSLGAIAVARHNWHCAAVVGRTGQERCSATAADAATSSAVGGTVEWSARPLKGLAGASFARPWAAGAHAQP